MNTFRDITTILHACKPLVFWLLITKALCLPADKPFLVIWNSPSEGCMNSGLNLSYFNIITNEHGAFFGENSNIYYTFGRFPHYKGNTPVYGGLPQLGDVAQNVEAITRLVNSTIPDKDFNGIAVFDWETWRASFAWNWTPFKHYQYRSEDLVKQKHPDWSSSQIISEAEKEFNLGAEKFFGGTLNIARSMRPRGHFGFYAYPKCTGTTHNGTRCDSFSRHTNDKLAYLYAGSTGYFPRIYLGAPVVSDPWVTAAVKESLRLRSLYGAPWTKIMPYTLYAYGAKSPFYTEADLDVTIKQSADAGADGIVIWGSSASVHTHQKCLDLINYVNTVLGPYILKLTSFVEKCSLRLCSNHGRCVVPDIADINYRSLTKREDDDYGGYICQCYDKWSGTHCEQPGRRKP